MSNKRQLNRLLNVALALRQYEHPERFDMGLYLHDIYTATDEVPLKKAVEWCGTPGCALGTYASRGDLQRVIKVQLETSEDEIYNEETGKDEVVKSVNPMMVSYVTGDDIYCHSDSEILEHFGITFDEANELFNWDGCGNAKTPLEAAAYIEGFVARKMLEERPATSVYRLAGPSLVCATMGEILRNALNK